MQIDILLRVLADRGIHRIICTPDERLALLSIGAELDHDVKSLFRLNARQTYNRWLREADQGKEPGRPGRPPKFGAEVIEQIVRIAKENITFGLGKIVGEMKKLGVAICSNTVKAILRQHGITPPDERQYSITGTWRKFVANVDSLVACDFLTKPIHSLFGTVDAFVLVFIHLGSRRVWMSPATVSPNDDWCRQQAVHAYMWIEEQGFPFRHLIRDKDRKFTERFDAVFNERSDARHPVVRTGIRMPVMNSYCESFIGHFQAECLDHFVCFSLDQLDHIVGEYQIYYNAERPHQGVGNRVLDPDWKEPPPVGPVRRRKILGGLLNSYYRDVA